jgi:hypothetical protein
MSHYNYYSRFGELNPISKEIFGQGLAVDYQRNLWRIPEGIVS